MGVVAPWISALRVRRTQVVDEANLQGAMEGMLRVRAGAACTPARSVQQSRRRIHQKDTESRKQWTNFLVYRGVFSIVERTKRSLNK